MKTNKYILLVDDDPLLSKLYEKKLKSAGYNIKTASDGEAAISKVSEEKPDLIILDVMMPKMNGIEVLKKLRADEKTRNIQVIILTNQDSSTEEMETLHKLGMHDCLIKSETSMTTLVDRVCKLITK